MQETRQNKIARLLQNIESNQKSVRYALGQRVRYFSRRLLS